MQLHHPEVRLAGHPVNPKRKLRTPTAALCSTRGAHIHVGKLPLGYSTDPPTQCLPSSLSQLPSNLLRPSAPLLHCCKAVLCVSMAGVTPGEDMQQVLLWAGWLRGLKAPEELPWGERQTAGNGNIQGSITDTYVFTQSTLGGCVCVCVCSVAPAATSGRPALICTLCQCDQGPQNPRVRVPWEKHPEKQGHRLGSHREQMLAS